MRAKTLMVQGTGSDVGKSVFVAALCRIFRDAGFRVAPFKAQNMALNSFVTKDGGEIGRAQATQAFAARVEPHVDMNPILMKPTADTNAQIIFRGKVVQNMSVQSYAEYKQTILPHVLQCLDNLRRQYDLVIIEGAGSPAEVNLKDQDIVNMRIALHAGSPVVLVGDIDRGGVFASLVGTLELLTPEERRLVRAFVINKFRGDRSLLQPGIDFLTERTGVPTAAVLPYFHNWKLPEEDRLQTARRSSDRPDQIRVRVIRLPYLSNATDFDALALEPDVDLLFVTKPSECVDADLVILPGSKSTVADLALLKERGFPECLLSAERKFSIVGICAGYQMLGTRILDAHSVESAQADTPALGIIPATTQFVPVKCTRQITAYCESERQSIRGYQIHHGIVVSPAGNAWFVQDTQPEGFADPIQRIYGTSIHGLFDASGFRRAFLNRIRADRGLSNLASTQEDTDQPYREWAEFVRCHCNIPLIQNLVEQS